MCILLDYIYITRWYTDPTVSSSFLVFLANISLKFPSQSHFKPSCSFTKTKFSIHRSLLYFIKLRARRSGMQYPAGARDSSLLKSVQTGSGAQPASYSLSVVVLSKWVKRLGREIDHTTQLRIIRAKLLLSLHVSMPWTGTTLLLAQRC